MATFYEDTMERRRMLPMSLGMASPNGVLTQNVQPGAALPRSMQLRNQIAELEAQQDDMSAIQAYARQLGESGQAATLNALAAQFAGEQFQPVQAQFLKRASAAQEPMRIGKGMVTPSGQYIEDPGASREASIRRLSRELEGVDRLEAAQAAQAERIAEQRRAQQERIDARRESDLRHEQLRRDLAANRPQDDSKTWRAEDNLRGDFDKLTKDLREELNATSKITQIVTATPPGQKPDAITQQSLVILLNKFLDPGSVVREGEFDRVVKAQGLIGQAQNLADRILKGQPLDANTIKQINGLAQFYAQAATQKIQSIANNYGEIARRRNLDVNSVISDPRYRGGGAPSSNDFAAAAAAELERRRKGGQ